MPGPAIAAISARIVRALAGAVGMQDGGAGVAHNVGICVGQNFEQMAGCRELIDETGCKALFHAQLRLRLSPGPSEHPARAIRRGPAVGRRAGQPGRGQ